jgi:hypothetical protein
MWPVTQRYLDTIARPHTQLTYIEFLKAGQVVSSFTGGVAYDPNTSLPIRLVSGNVQVSRQTIRRTCTINFHDSSGILIPESADDLLAPYGTEMRVYVGVRYWDSPLAVPVLMQPPVDFELVPVGTFVITDIESDYPMITVSGSDRMWYMSAFASPYVVASGQTVAAVLSQLLGLKVPTNLKDINFPDDSGADNLVPTQVFDANNGTADALHTVALVGGWQIFADPMGTFVATHEPTIDDPEVVAYSPGNGMIGHTARTIGGEVFNAVVFTNEGANTATPVRGYAEDTNPESLTYAPRIGRRPKFAASPLITTVAQAQKAARTELQRTLGVSDVVTVHIQPNHALDAGDIIRVTDATLEINNKYIVDQFTVNLRASDGAAMDLQCRSQVIR